METSLRQVLEAAPDAIGVHRAGKFLWVNARQAELFGYPSPSAMLGISVLDRLHPSHRTEAQGRIDQMHGTGQKAPPREMQVLRTDGSLVSIEVSSLPFEFEGAPAILSIARDITARKLLQSRLLQSDRLSAVGKLAAGVAHEINNPLSYVIANVGMVQGELPEILRELRKLHVQLPAAGQGALGQLLARLEEARAALADASEGAERVRVTVRDLKSFSRPDDLGTGPVDIRRVVESSINLAWNEIRHRARLSKAYGRVPLVDSNEGKLAQVFLNLLLHAAQSIPEGARDQNEIRIAVSTDEQGRAAVSISDTGPGIAANDLGRVFDPFFSTNSSGSGAGLGLSMCQGLVAELGGEITVESAPGCGSTFRVVVPSALRIAPPPAELPARPAPISKPPPPATRARVLVIDDEPAVGNALRRMLAGHEVVLATSGRDAVRALSGDGSFDLVLCDLMMPEMTGMDVHDELAREFPGLERRLVFMTGGVFTERARAFLARVPNVRLEKPFRGDELRRLVVSSVEARA